MKNWILQHAFSLVAGPIVGVIGYFVLEYLQRAIAWLDEQPAWVKRASALVLSSAITALFPVLGLAIPAECVTIDENTVGVCLGAIANKHWLTASLGTVFALLVHKILHLKPKYDSGA